MESLSDIDESRRKLLIYLLSSGAFASLPGCSSGVVQSAYSAPEQMPAHRSIYEFSGDVKVNGQTATLDTRVEPGDVIETTDNSYVIFVANKDAFILRSNSQMAMALPTVTSSAFQLNRGKVLSVIATRKVEIRTPSAVIRIRGTGIYLETEPELSYVCTCYGVADLATADTPAINETITSTHHSAPRYILADSSRSDRIQPAPFKNHDDQELLLIETLVGRTTPYVVPRRITRSRTGYF